MLRRSPWQTPNIVAIAALLALGLAGVGRADEPAQKSAAPLLDFASGPKTIVCLGDSVTGVYYHTGGVRAYPEMLEIALRKRYPEAKITVVNAGISGHTTQNGLDRLDRDVLEKKPDLVTVSFGLNDMTRIPEEQFRRNLETIAAHCREAKAKVVLCTPNAVIDTSGRPRTKLERYCDVIRATAKDLGLTVCDQYAEQEALRQKDARAFRLLMSDEIHPNMDGHKMMAEALCRTIGGKSISLSDVPPPPALERTLAKIAKKEPVKVLAMPPYDALIGPALRKVDPDARIEVTAWPVEGQALRQIEGFSREKVRAMKPDLVVIAVPRLGEDASDEEFVRSSTWIMNWALSFGIAEWDAFVVHPSVAAPNTDDDGKASRDDLVRTLVKAQHLHLIDRPEGDNSTAAAVFEKGVEALRGR